MTPGAVLQKLWGHQGRQLWEQIVSACHGQVSPKCCESTGAYVTAQGTGRGECVTVCAPEYRSKACPGAWRMRKGAKRKDRAGSGGVCAGSGARVGGVSGA